ncbi:MAG: hypothetical protein CMB82_12265 [Flammeovirgaceae bacterium]|nr:hypothetical protein [Flammeovirgaceae bacterium]|tara:strand:- start:444 stop:917 length:474 start_codon:yes stop_codon:yes gene_type:complete
MKYLNHSLLFILLFLFCQVSFAQNLKNQRTEKKYTIGFWPELGGYVFKISEGGAHGCVVEMQDQGKTSWLAAKEVISDSLNHSIEGAKFTDWRLPTNEEQHKIYSQKRMIGGFVKNYYWSTGENNTDEAYWQDFNSGFQEKAPPRASTYSVRSVREF